MNSKEVRDYLRGKKSGIASLSKSDLDIVKRAYLNGETHAVVTSLRHSGVMTSYDRTPCLYQSIFKEEVI